MPAIGEADVAAACDLVCQFLEPLSGRNWTAHPPDLDWSCERTLQHVINTELYYAMHLATSASSPIPFPRGPAAAAGLGPPELLTELRAINAVLVAVIRTAAPSTRAVFAGVRTDAVGVAALACDELFINTWDMGRGLGQAFTPPGDMAQRVVERLFPWAPKDPDPWSVLLWCNGRTALADRPRLEPDWPRWIAPLEDWDGVDPTAKPAPRSR